MKTIKLTCMTLAVVMIGSVLSGKLFAQAAGDTPITEPVIEKEEKCDPDFDFPGINPHTYNNWGSGSRSETGDFLVSNFATGYAFNNFFWRGYAFMVSRTVTVTELWGGWGNTPSPCGASAFSGAIFSAIFTGGTVSTGGLSAPQVQPTAVLTSVGFTSGAQTDGEPVERVPLSSNLVLTPGNLYIIAQGSHAGGSSCHRASNQLDNDNLLLGSMIIDEWYPELDRAYRFGGTGTPANRVGANAERLDEHRVLVGFRYLTDVEAAEIMDAETTGALISGTDDVLFTGMLENSGVPATGEGGNTNTALYFEVADNIDFTGSTLYSADNPAGGTVTGPQTDIPFERTVADWATGKDPNATYYVRAVAINEHGRTTGAAVSFNILTCANPTSGGTIAAEQIICSNGVPAAFTSTELPSGHDGDLEYKWQKSTTDESSGFSDIVGATSEAFDETASLTQTTWYRRMARVTCDPVDWSSAEASNVLQVTVVPQPTAPGLNKVPTDAEVCEGQTLTVSSTAGSGGTGTVTDEYRYSTDNGDTWSDWSTSLPSFTSVEGTNLIQSRRTATGAGCTTSGINEVSWTVVAQPTAPGLSKNPTNATVCEGQTLTVSTSSGSGGTGTVTDQYRYSTNNGDSWSAWSTEVPSFAAVEGTNLIESRRTATGMGCTTSSINEVSWTVVPQPTAPGLNKVPTDAEVCEGQTLTVSSTAGSGGTGTVTDEYRYSTDNGDTWSDWSTSVPSFAAVVGTNIIQSRRTATGTGCNESSYYQVSWTVVAQPTAPGLTKDPDDATVCEGSLLTVNTTPGTGGAGNIVDEYSYSTDGGTTWGAWTSTEPEFAAVVGNTNMIRSRRTADWPGCTTSGVNQVSWEVEPLPVAGTLTPSPLCPLVHTGMDVSATHSGSAGGNGDDKLEYRTNDGTTWSAWLAYTSGDNISTTGLSMVEIQNQRLADYCAPSVVSVSWEVGNTRARNLTKEWEYFTVADALADNDKLDPGDEILIRMGTITDTFTTDGKGGLSFFFGESICPVTINGSAAFSADDRLNVRLDDQGHNKIAVLDNLHLNNATLNVIVDGNPPSAGTAYTIFTSPNNPGEFSNPSLIKTNGHQFILSYEEDDGKWNVVLTSLAPLLKMEIRHIESPR